MRKQRSEDNRFDDLDMWDDFSVPDEKKNPYEKTTKRGTDDDLLDFYGTTEDTSGQVRSRQRRNTRTQKPGYLAAVLVVALLVAAVVLGRGLFGNNMPSEEGPSYIQKPVETVAPAPATDPAPAPVTDPADPVVTIPAQTVPETDPVPASDYRYYASKLTAEQRKLYDEIKAGIAVRADQIGPFHVGSEEELYLIVQSLFYDYPEYFWFRGGYSGSYMDYDTYLEYTMTPGYAFTAQEYAGHAAYVESATQPVIAALSGKSDYEKVKGVYEYLIDNTIYDRAYTGTTIYEMFSKGRGVCEGYARATQYMLTKLGVEVIYVTGYGGGQDEPRSSWESHAWNIVKIDGLYYQLDTTWGDPVSADWSQSKNFNYLNLTDEEMERNHEIDAWTTYPACTSTRHNYYAYEGYYLEVFSKETIKAWFQECYDLGLPLEFKCADENIYRQAYSWLIDNGGFGELYESVSSYGTYWYSNNDVFYILSVSK